MGPQHGNLTSQRLPPTVSSTCPSLSCLIDFQPPQSHGGKTHGSINDYNSHPAMDPSSSCFWGPGFPSQLGLGGCAFGSSLLSSSKVGRRPLCTLCWRYPSGLEGSPVPSPTGDVSFLGNWRASSVTEAPCPWDSSTCGGRR